MKKIIVIIIIVSSTVSPLFGQNYNDTSSKFKHWVRDIEHVVFDKATSFDSDSFKYVEFFLFFEVNTKTDSVENVVCLFGNNGIDSSNQVQKLKNSPFIQDFVAKIKSNAPRRFYIQPVLYGKTVDVDRRVVDPEFYEIKKIPTLANSEESSFQMVILLKQINLSMTIRK